MADYAPVGVIASSSRFNDITPYCSHLFKTSPHLWGSVFPWDFPQDAPRAVEEDFLRRFFDDRTIYMQGGAGSAEEPGQGFRFLKQVWYTCALWNLEHRVPAVEQWYWAQPDNIQLLNDPTIREFFFKDDVTPSTFFKKEEFELYGVRFLSVVMKAIQNTARQHDAKKQDNNGAKDVPSISIPAEQAPATAGNKQMIHSAPPTQQELTMEPEQAVSGRRATLGTLDRPQIAPMPTTSEPLPPPVQTTVTTQAAAPVPKDMPVQSRKRGNSTAKRYNNRGGHFAARQPSHYEGQHHSAQPISPQLYDPPMMQDQQRGPAMEYMPRGQQGQQPMNMPRHMQYIPGQYGQPGVMAPHGMPHPPGLGPNQGPIWYNHNAFPDFNNGRFTDRGGNTDFRSFSNDGNNAGRGGYRRQSHGQGQGQRGGKSRGANSLRGRSGRGRESFTSDDRPAFVNPFQHGQRNSNEQGIAGMNPRGRRGSVYAANTWRSASDHPQAGPGAPHMKENVAPAPPTNMTDRHIAPMGPPPFEHKMPTSYQPQAGARPFQATRADSAASNRVSNNDQLVLVPEVKLPPGMYCDRHKIGPNCTFVVKLVLFDVPAAVHIDELKHIFSAWAPFRDVTRTSLNPNRDPSFVEHQPFVWIQFDSHEHARQFLDRKPKTWLDGRPLRAEVPREYWDVTHDKYQSNGRGVFGQSAGASGYPGVFRQPAKNHENAQVPVVLRRAEQDYATSAGIIRAQANVEEVQSAETTPTPSGASTPKKKPTTGQKKQKRKENKLRQASLAAATELKQSADSHHEARQTHLTSSTTEDVPIAPADVPAQDQTVIEGIPATGNQNERSWSVQTEVQTSQEPSFTPTDDLQTRLPESGSTVRVNSPQASVPPSPSPRDTAIAQPEGTVTDEPESEVESFRQFRDSEAAEAAQHKKVEGPPDDNVDEAKCPSATTAETPVRVDEEHVDDSFHTASGSPGSVIPEARDVSVTDFATSSASQEQANDTAVAKPEPVDLSTTEVDPKPLESKQSESVLSPDEAVSPKTVTKAPIPQLPSKPKVTISAADGDTKDEKSDHRSTSESTLVPQTQAFVTAPNTPAVGQEALPDQPLPEVEPETRAVAVKKAEKPKGPAQTQSFSLYGKKNEKKSKSNKKGTIKAKPASGIASESSSRAVSVSGVTTPTVDAACGEGSRRASKNSDMEMMRVSSKASTDESKENEALRERRKVTNDEGPIPLQETPSKRGKLGSFMAGIFGGGGQSQPSSSSTRSNSAASAKNWLTKSKAPDRRPSTDTQLNDDHSSGTFDIDTAGNIASKEAAITSAALSSSTTLPAQVDGSITGDILPADHQQSTLGLGISNIAIEQSTQSGTGSKKKKKPKKKKSNSAADGLKITTEFSPEVMHEDISEVFRFKSPQANTIPSIVTTPQAAAQADDHGSNASSQTMGPDTPSSDVPSPKSGRKLPHRPPGSGHLMEARSPAWKKTRRVISRSQHDISADGNAEEEPDEEAQLQLEVIELPDKDVEDPKPRIYGPQREKIFVYVGAPVRDEIEDGPEVEQSRDKLQRLAIEELRRKRNNT